MAANTLTNSLPRTSNKKSPIYAESKSATLRTHDFSKTQSGADFSLKKLIKTLSQKSETEEPNEKSVLLETDAGRRPNSLQAYRSGSGPLILPKSPKLATVVARRVDEATLIAEKKKITELQTGKPTSLYLQRAECPAIKVNTVVPKKKEPEQSSKTPPKHLLPRNSLTTPLPLCQPQVKEQLNAQLNIIEAIDIKDKKIDCENQEITKILDAKQKSSLSPEGSQINSLQLLNSRDQLSGKRLPNVSLSKSEITYEQKPLHISSPEGVHGTLGKTEPEIRNLITLKEFDIPKKIDDSISSRYTNILEKESLDQTKYSLKANVLEKENLGQTKYSLKANVLEKENLGQTKYSLKTKTLEKEDLGQIKYTPQRLDHNKEKAQPAAAVSTGGFHNKPIETKGIYQHLPSSTGPLQTAHAKISDIPKSSSGIGKKPEKQIYHSLGASERTKKAKPKVAPNPQILPLPQQRIREEQEKKILELHHKNQQEIYQLRFQVTELPPQVISRSSSLANSQPIILPSQRNYHSDSQRLSSTIPQLIRCNTYDNACQLLNRNVKSKKLASILKQSSQFDSNNSIRKAEGDQTYSFSGYLTRTRSKDSLSSIKDDNYNLSKSNNNNNNNNNNDKNLNNSPKHNPLSRSPKSLLKSHSSILKKTRRLTRPKKVEFLEPEKETSGYSDTEPIQETRNDNRGIKRENTYPTKPPRGEKSSKTPIAKPNAKENKIMKQQKPEPRPLKEVSQTDKSIAETRGHPQLHRSIYNNSPIKAEESQQHEKRITQTDSASEKDQSEKFELEHEAKVPQPPIRGAKSPVKGPSTTSHSSTRKQSVPRIGAVEGVLITACRLAEEEQVMRLLRDLTKNATNFDPTFINECDIAGRTALSHSCSNGYYRVVEFLTSQPDCDLNLIDSDGCTPLHYAAQGGHVEVVSHLVNTCSRQVDLDARNNLGFTPLMKAAIQGRTKIAKILLFAGASPHLRDHGRGLCALEWAKYTGRLTCSDLIESVQRSCSSHIKDRWTNDPDLKLLNSPGGLQYGVGGIHDNKDSWLKHKIKKAFHKTDSKKEFSVASNLSNLAACVSSPLVPCHPPEPAPLPKVQVTEVNAPDCYYDPSDSLSPQSSDEYSSGEESPSSSTPTTPDDYRQPFPEDISAEVDTTAAGSPAGYNRSSGGYNRGVVSSDFGYDRSTYTGQVQDAGGYTTPESTDRFDF